MWDARYVMEVQEREHKMLTGQLYGVDGVGRYRLVDCWDGDPFSTMWDVATWMAAKMVLDVRSTHP